MKTRSLARAFAALTMALGATVLLPAASAHAGNFCGSTDPLVGSVSGAVTASDPDWYRFNSGGAAVTMVPSSGDPDMKIMNSSCSAVVCYPFAGGTETCILPPGVYNVGVLYWSGPGGVATYTLSVTSTQCGDGIDNDNDGRTDYPSDPGCSGPEDTSEGVPCSVVATATVCAGVTTGTTVLRQGVRTVEFVPGPGHFVEGYVDVYRFRLPTGDTVALPCVTLDVDGILPNPCADAGGVFVDRELTLVSSIITEPRVQLGEEIAYVGVCNGELVATVNGIGITSLKIATLCSGLSGGTAH